MHTFFFFFFANIAFKKQHAERTVKSDSVYCESLYIWHLFEMVFVEADFEGLHRTIIKACLKERMHGDQRQPCSQIENKLVSPLQTTSCRRASGSSFWHFISFYLFILNGIWNTAVIYQVCFRKELLIYKDRKRDIWLSYLEFLISIHGKFDFIYFLNACFRFYCAWLIRACNSKRKTCLSS